MAGARPERRFRGRGEMQSRVFFVPTVATAMKFEWRDRITAVTAGKVMTISDLGLGFRIKNGILRVLQIRSLLHCTRLRLAAKR
jgi:hypothetical protein